MRYVDKLSIDYLYPQSKVWIINLEGYTSEDTLSTVLAIGLKNESMIDIYFRLRLPDELPWLFDTNSKLSKIYLVYADTSNTFYIVLKRTMAENKFIESIPITIYICNDIDCENIIFTKMLDITAKYYSISGNDIIESWTFDDGEFHGLEVTNGEVTNEASRLQPGYSIGKHIHCEDYCNSSEETIISGTSAIPIEYDEAIMFLYFGGKAYTPYNGIVFETFEISISINGVEKFKIKTIDYGIDGGQWGSVGWFTIGLDISDYIGKQFSFEIHEKCNYYNPNYSYPADFWYFIDDIYILGIKRE